MSDKTKDLIGWLVLTAIIGALVWTGGNAI
jgi:hypothetical protein